MIYSKALTVSLAGHVLFFFGVFFTFSQAMDTGSATTVSFLGTILTAKELESRKVSGSVKSFSPKFNIASFGQEAKSGSSDLNLSFQKPPYPAGTISRYPKHQNKFLVSQDSGASPQKTGQNNFATADWEKIELRLKTE